MRHSIPDPDRRIPPTTKGQPWPVLPDPDGTPPPVWRPDRTWTSDGSDGRDDKAGRAA